MIGKAWCSSITEEPSIFLRLKLSPAVTSSKAFQLLSLSQLVVRTDDNHRLTSYADLLIDHSLVPFRVPSVRSTSCFINLPSSWHTACPFLPPANIFFQNTRIPIIILCSVLQGSYSYMHHIL